MNIYLIERTTPHDYDEYDSAVVIAKDEEEARATSPSMDPADIQQVVPALTAECPRFDSWVGQDAVKVTLIGLSYTQGRKVICASFNAG